ncbi:MAG: hypothetical protein R2758_08255 [Bacteroidales bacterium]
MNRRIEQLRQGNSSLVKVHKLAVTPGGREMLMLEIGKSGPSVPAVLVAPASGITPLATEAALEHSHRAVIVAQQRADMVRCRWGILTPVHVISPWLHIWSVWATAGLSMIPLLNSEDGYNDLDGNGIITQMG